MTTSQEMEMEVVNRLSSLITNVGDQAPARGKFSAQLSRHPGQVGPELFGLLIVGIEMVQRDNVGLRGDENVSRSHRLNIAERNRVLRFHHLVGRNLPRHQTTEQASRVHCLFELGEHLAKCVAVGANQCRQQLQVGLPHRHIP